MDPIIQRLNLVLPSEPTSVKIKCNNILLSSTVIYIIELGDKSKSYHKEYIHNNLIKNIIHEIAHKSKLWNFAFNSPKYQLGNGYNLEIILTIEPTKIDEFINESYKSNALILYVLSKNTHKPIFSKFDDNQSYLPGNTLLNPPNNFEVKLYDYQKKSLHKMIQIENQDTEFIINYSSTIPFLDKEYNFDPVEKWISDDTKSFKLKTNGGILADEMGLGKTITSLSLIATNQSTYNENLKISRLDNKTNKIYSKATLIVCPSHLTKQWESEAKKCNKNIKILVINTKKDHEKLNFGAFLSNDIIITSHQFLMNFKYYPTLHFGHITPSCYNPQSRATKINQKLKEILENVDINKIKETLCPIFEFFYFHRLILDEGHEIFGEMLGNNSLSKYMANWLSSIDSDNYWFVSGSPFVNMTGVENAFKYINLVLTDTDEGFEFPYRHHGSYNVSSNIMLQEIHEVVRKNYVIDEILKNVCIRHKKSDIQDLDILGYEEQIEWINFTDLERNIYTSKVGKIDATGLLKLCCHPLVLESSKKLFGDIELDLEVMEKKLIEHHKNNIVVYDAKLSKLDQTNQSYHMHKKTFENIISESKFLLNILEKLNETEVGEEEAQVCAICFEEKSLSLTKCGHIYCKECITEWMTKRHNCPTCKKDLTSGDIFLIKKENKEDKKVDDINPLINKYGSKLGKVILMIKSLLTQDSTRIIVFSQWDCMLSLISKTLSENGIANSTVKGNVWSRTSAINKFKTGKTVNGDDSKVILLSLKNAASGTNLTEASHIFFIEPINDKKEVCRAIEGQALARACRIGQQQKIKLFRLLVKDTIEEDIYNKFYVN
jgi:SNF2 family DNA or RNA helicase